jgi:hypothetical protein
MTVWMEDRGLMPALNLLRPVRGQRDLEARIRAEMSGDNGVVAAVRAARDIPEKTAQRGTEAVPAWMVPTAVMEARLRFLRPITLENP